MQDEICPTCNGEGRPQMCPRCYKVGQVKKKLRKRKRQDWFERQEELLAKNREEVEALWKEATMELWVKNRGEYMRLINKIKRKEAQLL